MNENMLSGRLPDRLAGLVLASGEYPELADGLRRLGIGVVVTTADMRLPEPVKWHPDMQACYIGGKVIVLRDSSLLDALRKHGIMATVTQSVPRPDYPNDVLCNVLAWDGWALGNMRSADRTIIQAAETVGATWINVKQGYAACVAALVDERSVVTADLGIADRLERHGIQVLRIGAGAVNLPGYQYGFIGGCCGKLAPDVMAFAGRLDSHPDGKSIRGFLAARGVRAVELMDCELMDVGGIITLC